MNNVIFNRIFSNSLNRIYFIKYKTVDGIFDRPFTFINMNDLIINLADCMFNQPMTIKTSDIQSVKILHEDDVELSKVKSQEEIDKYKEVISVCDNMNNDILSQLLFRVDVIENERSRFLSLKCFNLMKSNSISEYIGLANNTKEMVDKFKTVWLSKIVEKRDQVVTSIDVELTQTQDESIISELNVIKDMLVTASKDDVESNLLEKNTYLEVIGYWPTLLQPGLEF